MSPIPDGDENPMDGPETMPIEREPEDWPHEVDVRGDFEAMTETEKRLNKH